MKFPQFSPEFAATQSINETEYFYEQDLHPPKNKAPDNRRPNPIPTGNPTEQPDHSYP